MTEGCTSVADFVRQLEQHVDALNDAGQIDEAAEVIAEACALLEPLVDEIRTAETSDDLYAVLEKVAALEVPRKETPR